MPCLIYPIKNHPLIGDIYLLPPIQYPDGKWYLKIGAFPHQLQIAATEDELKNWFQHEPSDEETHATKQSLKELMPELKVLSYRAVPCAWTYTPQAQPYIKILENEDAQGRIAVATAGCGRGAKSSDAIGKLGAQSLME
jgi:sarcosine oxidase